MGCVTPGVQWVESSLPGSCRPATPPRFRPQLLPVDQDVDQPLRAFRLGRLDGTGVVVNACTLGSSCTRDCLRTPAARSVGHRYLRQHAGEGGGHRAMAGNRPRGRNRQRKAVRQAKGDPDTGSGFGSRRAQAPVGGERKAHGWQRAVDVVVGHTDLGGVEHMHYPTLGKVGKKPSGNPNRKRGMARFRGPRVHDCCRSAGDRPSVRDRWSPRWRPNGLRLVLGAALVVSWLMSLVNSQATGEVKELPWLDGYGLGSQRRRHRGRGRRAPSPPGGARDRRRG